MNDGATFFDPDIARDAWRSCARRDPDGEDYLASRGLYVESLTGLGVVRFTRSGAPAVRLHSLWIGPAVVNVVRRNLPADVDAGRPKVHGLRDCGTSGCLVGNLDEIREERRDAVLCEGVIDTLTALCVWPAGVICGAHGAGRLAELGGEVAARCYAAGTRMRIVHDDDVTGIRAAAGAIRAALAAGLRLGRDLDVVDLGGAHDLNAAWKAGWSP